MSNKKASFLLNHKYYKNNLKEDAT